MTLFTAGLAPSDQHAMVTDCPSTTGSGVMTDTVGLSTIIVQLCQHTSKDSLPYYKHLHIIVSKQALHNYKEALNTATTKIRKLCS